MAKSIARKTKDFNPTNCAVTYCMNIIGGKWKPVIIHLIRNGTNRYSLMQKAITEISKQTLTNQLRELEVDGVLERIVFAEVPPRVEYQITQHGQTLLPIIDAMKAWGRENMPK
ncbi:winged helix-turn-helix transcriptional regulator [Mucilaginibacter lappiensis]|uniref:DNA-binding HxlR family transcriptional regulator n=1 Tax=Mucilaginibacter lappiensis TaxID=354630 RepID=A0A1N6VHP3_9SPHI|nr:helix-turn-helix domain-containing protein [Mucilaginibacter lappiensis]MBB6109143.1 DNA-binding HxlR family transcriptional regulator [Mucilaginibacter lappiensis]MBB6127265.1 DNA-binding HxlR family transcriptional regulator [Mucilaginibacter lappiensis]SIQ77314.1 transcriptional regulator, HxlR family [Mucilaginibacter lappiensis]